jgi:hypothetical protein
MGLQSRRPRPDAYPFYNAARLKELGSLVFGRWISTLTEGV